MKVLHISSAKSWRGGEQQIAYLLQALGQYGVEQWVFCPQNSALAKYCQAQHIPFESYRKLSAFNPVTAYAIRRVVQRQSIDLLHIHDAHAHTLACLAAQFFGVHIPFVLTRHLIIPIRNNAISRWKYRHPSIRRIICISHFIKKVLAADLPDTKQLEVIPASIDVQKFAHHSTDFSLRKTYDVSSDTLIIANIAAIEPFKDYFTFVDTAQLLIEAKVKARFFIIGNDAGQAKALKSYIAAKKLTPHFVFTGFQRNIISILRSIDVLLFTSKTEGLGISLLEAFASGVPVVSTNAGGIPEVVLHEKTGLLAPVGDATALAQQVKRILDKPLLRDTLIAQAKIHLQQFSIEKMAQATYRVYQAVEEEDKK
ncbi:MAG: glycosyltransferase family 4 protein [Bacteroidota bacterium]